MNNDGNDMIAQRLRDYICDEFEKADAPDSKAAVELKEELIQNLTDKCSDLMAEGKTSDAAYNIAVAGLGDIGALVMQLRHNDSAGEAERQRERRRHAALTAIAVMLYIMCVIPVIFSGVIGELTGVVLMFVMIAVATGLIIYSNMTKSKPQAGDTMVEDFQEWNRYSKSKRSAFRAITAALWALTVAIYIIVSFTTMAWHITWIIFLIAAAVEGIVKAVIELLN